MLIKINNIHHTHKHTRTDTHTQANIPINKKLDVSRVQSQIDTLALGQIDRLMQLGG